MPRYIVHDLETDKLELHTAGKADWLALPAELRDTIKRAFLWSSRRNCWVSRALGGRVWCQSQLLAAGFEDRGQTGERMAFADRVAAKQEAAADRADRMEGRQEKADAEAHARFNSQNIETLRSLQGEPVKLGHHSAKRHLRLIEKADNDMRKGCEAVDRKEHYARRAEAARQTAEGEQYSNPGFLARRIAEAEADERKLIRLQEGADPVYFSRLAARLEEVRDKLGFFRHCLEEVAKTVTVWSRETLKGKQAILIRGIWRPIVKLNPKTVSVLNSCFPTPDSQRRYALKYTYAEVQDAR